MFGQNNNDQNQQQPSAPVDQNPMLQNSAPPAGFMSPSATVQPSDDSNTGDTSSNDQPSDTGAPMIMDDNPTSFVAPATPADEEDAGMPPASDSVPTPSDTPVGNDDLLGMKQQALQELTPLVNHLDQTPEEKFRTVMMMIQASDDHTKLAEAFEAAKAITDDKIRAQALLDVINEINYFTQHQN